MRAFSPDGYFPRISAIDVQRDILGRNLNCAFVDIDNTIRSRADGLVPRDVRAWLARCKDAGVGVCLLSNNWHANALELAEELDLPIVAKAMKPLPNGYLAALRRMNASARETVVIGDQLCTDIMGAKLLGLRSYLVMPLASVDLPHMAVLRRLERALMGDAPEVPQGATACVEDCAELR